MKEFNTQETLLRSIGRKRKEMIDAGKRKGLTNKETVQLSKELDQLINLYMGQAS
ncbi:MAG TPA: aspartyl-phosphate phosphatase Spo0E family protein [Bacillales bacterium]|nr:aspartyl-phosphate phosphatase Spo0E family protein [Bacillales bacterium]